MANSRNQVDNILNISGPKVPRYVHTSPTAVHLTSLTHGQLGICFCTPVMANESVTFDSNVFVRADTSAEVPLDDIYTDIYYFYVPYRFLDEDFVKVLGDKHPLDDTDYAFPQITITGINESSRFEPNFLPFDLGWSFVRPADATDSDYNPDSRAQLTIKDTFNAYFLMAYWKIYNDFFRDENLDPYVDIDQLKNISRTFSQVSAGATNTIIPDSVDIDRLFYPALVNRMTDIYSRSLISPQYGDAHKIPGADFAWLDSTDTLKAFTNADGAKLGFTSGGSIFDEATGFLGLEEGQLSTDGGEYLSDQSITASSLGIKLRESLGTIQELSVAMSLQAMDYARMTHGHRYIETLDALWGSSMPDYLVGRAEYLGGITTTLNNIPVLSLENATLGKMAGNSASLFNDGGFTKSFPEPGVVLGVYCTRVYHKSAQGKSHYLNYKTLLDLPNIYVAEFGPMPLYQSEIANMGNANADKVFSYSKSWIHERMIEPVVGGIFNPNTMHEGATVVDPFESFRTKWSYTDYYEHIYDSDVNDGLPVYSPTWLKENPNNVARTLTGRLIPFASDLLTFGLDSFTTPQFMFGFYQHCKRTNFLPPDPDPLWYIRRL